MATTQISKLRNKNRRWTKPQRQNGDITRICYSKTEH